MPGYRQDLRRRLHALAFAQAGYFTAAQARDAGYTYQAQKYHVDHGNWMRVDRGIFRLPEWPAEPGDAFVRWVLWSRGRGVISHESALSVHGLSDVNPTLIHLTVPPRFSARDAAVSLHRHDLPRTDIEDRGGWGVTTPERTLLDVASTGIAPDLLDDAIDDALVAGLVTRARLLRRSESASAEAALPLERALARLQERADG